MVLYHELPDGREVPFDPDKPWNYLWSLPEDQWWYKTFEVKANMIAMRVAAADQWVEGTDSAVAHTIKQHKISSADPIQSLIAGGMGKANKRDRGSGGGKDGKASKADKGAGENAKVPNKVTNR